MVDIWSHEAAGLVRHCTSLHPVHPIPSIFGGRLHPFAPYFRGSLRLLEYNEGPHHLSSSKRSGRGERGSPGGQKTVVRSAEATLAKNQGYD